ncbi:MAG: class I SAM-dependent DNA methyltransferase, partial [Candidatus Eisenbacteria bacterium]
MKAEAARRLVRETLEGAFEKEAFVTLTKNLLKKYDAAPFSYTGNYIFAAFRPYIEKLERIGKYSDKRDHRIDILIVYLKKSTSLERARATQREFVAKYLKGSRGGELKDAALVAFVSPENLDWRFSFVRVDYRLDSKGDKVKVREELTPARRFSFLVGENENSHTAQSRLLPLLLSEGGEPSIETIQEAFSVERVAQEFFEKYRELFHNVREALERAISDDTPVRKDFAAKGIEAGDFAKKLLGQVVFLYFLQKKGWFGVERGKPWGSGSRHFLRELFSGNHGKYKNFFNDILEPLFYEALRLERSGDYYSRFDCRIPFLNGGLFDPIGDYDWWETDILLPNEIFSNKTKTREGDLGTGILDIFDRYNFTVQEDEPLEKDVAVDPEMLGKVFENLLEVKDRKSKGTYYTPREIVHYMCQQSLV